MSLTRDDILALIPHAGSMCLLDIALEWDEHEMRCLSDRFAQPDNPLRRADGTLGAACGIEIAGQAMALHGRLTGGDGPPQQGYLAAVREVRFAAPHIVAGELLVAVTRLLGDARGARYRFSLTQGNREIVAGRATVLFMAAT